ncbi:MAG: efflux RND transporter permease subunit [Acidobacteriota bacterium]
MTPRSVDDPNVPGQDLPRRESLTTVFYRNGYLLAAAVAVLLVGGLSALVSLPRLEDPRIDTRNAIVVTPVPGYSAERVDTLVTEVIEEALREVDEILNLESSSKAGASVISVELAASVDGTNNREIFSEIRDKLDEAGRRLPPEALPSLFDEQRGAVGFTLIVALSWDGPGEPSLGILDRLAEDLAARLRALPGTELVRTFGAPEEQITVTVDPALMADLGLGADALARAVAGGDAKGAAGVVRTSSSDILVEVAGELDSLERVAGVPLREGSSGDVVRLGDVAEVKREPRSPASEIAVVDGRRSVLVAARMATEVRVDRWADSARSALSDFEAETGQGTGVTLSPIFEQERYTSAQLSTLTENLFAGALVVMAVILVLMGWRLALIVGLALPLVVSSVFLGWQITGNAMHQMSIFGLIIALGLLIDNAIVVGDEVAKEKAAGRSAVDAVERAVKHLAVPLLSSTVTTVLAFAPILLLPGNIGDFVGSIGSSVIMAVLASYVLALTVTAALAGRFAQPPEVEGRFWRTGVSSPRLLAATDRWLHRAFRRPVAAILVALFLPLAGFVVARSLGNEFFPPVDRDLFQVQMWMPNDTAIGTTRERAAAVEALIREQPEVERVFWLVGASFPTVYYNLVMDRDDSPEYAQAIVQASSSTAAKAMIDDLQTSFDRRFPEAQLVVRQFGQGPPIQADVEYYLYGPDLGKLQDLGEQVRLALQGHPQVLVSRTSLPRGEPKLWLAADEDQARLAGLGLRDIADQLRGGLDGGVGGSVVEDLERLPVRIRWHERGDLGELASLPLVRPRSLEGVPLEALGTLRLRPEAGTITRYDGERTERIQGWTRNDALPIDVTNGVLERLEADGFELPQGYRLELGGAAAEDASAKAALFTYVPVLVTLTIATLVLSFGSVRLAGLLFVIAGLSLGLAMLATWSIGFPISFNTMLGTLGLLGVALNDSIVVLAAIRADPEARAGDVDAVVKQVLGTLRHVLSTTLTTIGGFLPLLLFVGGDFWPSLAIVLAGGIGGASILAVLFIPAAYVALFGRRRRARAPSEPVVGAVGVAS